MKFLQEYQAHLERTRAFTTRLAELDREGDQAEQARAAASDAERAAAAQQAELRAWLRAQPSDAAARAAVSRADGVLASARPDDLVRILDDLSGRDARLRQEITDLTAARRTRTVGAAAPRRPPPVRPVLD